MVTYNVPFMEVIFLWHSDHSVGRQTIHWVRWSRAHPLRLGCGDCTGLRSLLICSLTKILLTLITHCYAMLFAHTIWWLYSITNYCSQIFAVRQVGESTIGAYRLNARPTACMAMFPVGGHYNYDFWGLMSCYSDHIYASTNHVLASLDTLCNK